MREQVKLQEKTIAARAFGHLLHNLLFIYAVHSLYSTLYSIKQITTYIQYIEGKATYIVFGHLLYNELFIYAVHSLYSVQYTVQHKANNYSTYIQYIEGKATYIIFGWSFHELKMII